MKTLPRAYANPTRTHQDTDIFCRAYDYDILLRLEKTAPIVLTKEEEVQVCSYKQHILCLTLM